MNSSVLPFQRRFAASSSHSFLVVPTRDQALVGSDEMRLRYVESIRLPHPKWKEAMQAAKSVMPYATLLRQPGGLVLTSPAGGGISFFIQALLEEYPRNLAGSQISIPVLTLDLREVTSLDELVTPLLGRLNYPARHLDRSINPIEAFTNLAIACGVRLIVLENAHLIVEAGTQVQRAFANFICRVYELRGLPCALLGAPSLDRLIHGFPEISVRLPTRIQFDNFRRDSLWQSLLKTFAKALPLEKESPLGEPGMALKIHVSTMGNLSRLKQLAMGGIPLAVRQGTSLTCEILAQAHSTVFGSGSGIANPFLAKP